MRRNASKKNIVIALVCIISLLSNGTAFAGTALSNKKTISASGYSYEIYAEIYTSSSLAVARTSISSLSGNVPTGYMGILMRLYNSSGTLIKSSDWHYNSMPASGMNGPVSYSTTSGSYYSYGKAQIFNGNGYDEYSTYISPNQTVSSMASPLNTDFQENQSSIKSYQTNENGNTYGSGLFELYSGIELDLIAAYGIDGVFGYIYSKDLNTKGAENLEQAISLTKGNITRYIPLYENNGITQVGLFEITSEESYVIYEWSCNNLK